MATLKHIVNSKNPHVAPHQVWHFGPNDYKVIVNGVGADKVELPPAALVPYHNKV